MRERFCPKCKSNNVKTTTNYLDIIFGNRYWICNECGFHAPEFPQRTIKIKKGRKSKTSKKKT